MKLSELSARLIRYEERDGRIYHAYADSLDAAQGVIFLCPKCFTENCGAIGTHSVICWSRSRGVPDRAEPGPGRWLLKGTGISDLTLEADPPGTARSVQLSGGCGWHGFVNAGNAA